MRAKLKAWTDAKTEPKASRVFANLTAELAERAESVDAPQLEPHPKTGGHVATIWIQLSPSSWAETVTALIGIAQQFGRGWSISRRIDEELELLTNELSLPGISMVIIECRRAED